MEQDARTPEERFNDLARQWAEALDRRKRMEETFQDLREQHTKARRVREHSTFSQYLERCEGIQELEREIAAAEDEWRECNKRLLGLEGQLLEMMPQMGWVCVDWDFWIGRGEADGRPVILYADRWVEAEDRPTLRVR